MHGTAAVCVIYENLWSQNPDFVRINCLPKYWTVCISISDCMSVLVGSERERERERGGGTRPATSTTLRRKCRMWSPCRDNSLYISCTFQASDSQPRSSFFSSTVTTTWSLPGLSGTFLPRSLHNSRGQNATMMTGPLNTARTLHRKLSITDACTILPLGISYFF